MLAEFLDREAVTLPVGTDRQHRAAAAERHHGAKGMHNASPTGQLETNRVFESGDARFLGLLQTVGEGK